MNSPVLLVVFNEFNGFHNPFFSQKITGISHRVTMYFCSTFSSEICHHKSRSWKSLDLGTRCENQRLGSLFMSPTIIWFIDHAPRGRWCVCLSANVWKWRRPFTHTTYTIRDHGENYAWRKGKYLPEPYRDPPIWFPIWPRPLGHVQNPWEVLKEIYNFFWKAFEDTSDLDIFNLANLFTRSLVRWLLFWNVYISGRKNEYYATSASFAFFIYPLWCGQAHIPHHKHSKAGGAWIT